MPISSKQFFTDKSITDQIVCILYCEKLPENFYEVIQNYNYGYIVSPRHCPDNGEKEHYHLILRDMHGRKLDYFRVYDLLEKINPSPARPVVLRGGHAGLVDMSRYFAHIGYDDKQQFDLRPIEQLENINIDNNGICEDTKLQSIYAENYCFFDGGGLDFIKLIHETAREKAERRRDHLKQQLEEVLDYVYSMGVKNYAKLVQWCRKNGYIDVCISYNSLLNNVLCGLNSKDYKSNADASETYDDGSQSDISNTVKNNDLSRDIDCTQLDYSSVSYSDIADTQDALQTALNVSFVDTDIVKFFCWLHPNIALTDMKYNKKFVKRKFLECYDLTNERPRKQYKLAFDSFSVKHLHYMIM